MIYLLDCDIKGHEVVNHLRAAGLVTVMSCQTYDDFDKACIRLIPQVAPGDVIIIDTISSLANQTRGDHKLGIDMLDSVWDRSEIFFRDKYGQLGYEATQQQIMRRVRNFVAVSEIMAEKGVPSDQVLRVYIAAHQRDVTDQQTGMKGVMGPDVNPAFFSALYGTSTDMFRLDVMLDPVIDENTGAVKIPADMRVLYLKRNSEMTAKNRCRIDISSKLPNGILLPPHEYGLPKLWKVLDRKSGCLVVYAPGGSGKTTFLCSEAQYEYDQRKNNTNMEEDK